MKEKKFCHFCGFQLQKKFIEGRERLFCTVCNQPLYENPVPASCCVVVDKHKKVLLVQRSVEPKIGMWCLPGGFMEIGETPEETALRELNEETGICGKISNIIGVLSHPSALYGTVSITGYSVENFSGKIFPGDDAMDCKFFEYDKMPEIAFNSHLSFIRAYMAGYVS
ncbi:MAG: NUDIX hydrolase [Desulfobacteraceae bacterium]|nr:NUDIX hydrolase [Desulfobacteraceae bacterium]